MHEQKPRQPIGHINIAELNHGKASRLIKEIHETDKASLVQKNGKPIAVIVSYRTYQRLLERGIDLNDIE